MIKLAPRVLTYRGASGDTLCMRSALTQSDQRVIEEVLIQVRSWRELASGDWQAAWSWDKAGSNLQDRCGLMMGELHANRKTMTVAAEVESLIERLFEIGEFFQNFDNFALSELGGDPDDITCEWRNQLKLVDEIFSTARNLEGNMPLEKDTKAVHHFKLYDQRKKIIEESGQKVTVEEVYQILLDKKEISAKTTLSAFRKNIERGDKKINGERLTRHDKIRESGSIDKSSLIGDDEDDLSFHDY